MKKESEEFTAGKKLPLAEEFFSIQGEGFHAGKAAFFIRLGGCDIGCNWCDSRFTWNADIHPPARTDDLIKSAVDSGTDSVVVTGGEPLTWNLDYLCNGLKKNGISTYLETSGAYPLSGTWDWICLSPKRNMPPLKEICKVADELKIIIEDRNDFIWAEKYRKTVGRKCRLFLQPEWSRFDKVIADIVDYVSKNNCWRISLQIHKYMHIP